MNERSAAEPTVRSDEAIADIVKLGFDIEHMRITVESVSTAAADRSGVVAAVLPSLNTSVPLLQSEPQLSSSPYGQTVTFVDRFTASERAVYKAPERQVAAEDILPFFTSSAKLGTPIDSMIAIIATAIRSSIRVNPFLELFFTPKIASI